MRPSTSLVPLLALAALLAPVGAHAQEPAPVPAPATTPAPVKAPAKSPAEPPSDYWFTLSGSASLPNDSFGDVAEMGSQFLGGVHRRIGDRLTLGVGMGASNWSGVDIQSYHDIQITLDARFHFTRPSSRMRPFVQVGFGSYQVVSEAEPEGGAEPQRASENSTGLNYGGGVLFPIGKSALIGPVVLYHTAGSIPEIGSLTGIGDCKFISVGVELAFPMGR